MACAESPRPRVQPGGQFSGLPNLSPSQSEAVLESNANAGFYICQSTLLCAVPCLPPVTYHPLLLLLCFPHPLSQGHCLLTGPCLLVLGSAILPLSAWPREDTRVAVPYPWSSSCLPSPVQPCLLLPLLFFSILEIPALFLCLKLCINSHRLHRHRQGLCTCALVLPDAPHVPAFDQL